MSKKLSVFAIFSLFLTASCLSDKEFYKQDQKDVIDVNESVMIEEVPFETIENEEQAVEINEEVQITEELTVKTIEVPDRIFFDFDQSIVTGAASEILDIQAEWLANNPEIKITIEGHCDERGTREYNLALGERRATAAKKYLISKGIDSSRIKTISYGKEKPAYFGTTEDVHAKNRRSVVVVTD